MAVGLMVGVVVGTVAEVKVMWLGVVKRGFCGGTWRFGRRWVLVGGGVRLRIDRSTARP